MLRIKLHGDPSFRELVQRIRESAINAYSFQELPFEKLVEELDPERNLAQNPLFQVMFSLQNTPPAPTQLPDITMTPLKVDSGMSMFDLSLDIVQTDGVAHYLRV